MKCVCQNLILFILIKISLVETTSIQRFILNITCTFVAYALAYKGFSKSYLQDTEELNSERIKSIESALLISVIVLVYYIINLDITVYDKSGVIYILIQILYITSLIGITINSEKEDKAEETSDKQLSYIEVLEELETAITIIKRHDKMILEQYRKVSNLHRIEEFGLNIHKYTVCYTLSQLIEACKNYEFYCTIRSDIKRILTTFDADYPFYVIRSEKDIDTEKLNRKLFDKNYIAIVTNALQYDKDLVYNIVVNISENGEFIAEYSFENTPLRNMYINSKNLHFICGNINENIALWDRSRLGDNNKLDLRILRDLLIEQYMLASEKGLFNRYLEMSVYKKKCGILNKKLVYWEI